MLKPKKTKKVSNAIEYNKKTTTTPPGYVSQDVYSKAYKADKKGVVRSVQKSYINIPLPDRYIGSSTPERYVSMDTTGYSKGKPTYTLKKYTRNTSKPELFSPHGYKESYTEEKIPRSQVKPTIAKMKKFTK